MYCVYTYRDPRPNKNNAVVYVGKGQIDNNRHLFHWQNPDQCHNKGLRNFLWLLIRDALEPKIEIVFTCEAEIDAFAKECELITLFGRRDLKTGTLFNLTAGGEGTAELSPDVVAKRAATLTATMNTPEKKLEQSIRSKKDWANPASKEKRVSEMKVRVRDAEYRAKLSAAILESHKNPEVIEKISKASKDHWQDPEYRIKRQESLDTTIATPEHKERRGSATKAGWQNEETRAKRIQGIKASRTPELRKQIGESCAKLWTDEKREEQSAKMKAALASPEARLARSLAMKAIWEKRKRALHDAKIKV